MSDSVKGQTQVKEEEDGQGTRISREKVVLFYFNKSNFNAIWWRKKPN